MEITVKHYSSAFILTACALISCKNTYFELSDGQQRLAAELKDTTNNYLVEIIARPGFGGRMFCTHKVLDIDAKDGIVNEYLYAYCQEYYPKTDGIAKGTGMGFPVALQFKKQIPGYQVVNHQKPRDGGQYSHDVERIFPVRTLI